MRRPIVRMIRIPPRKRAQRDGAGRREDDPVGDLALVGTGSVPTSHQSQDDDAHGLLRVLQAVTQRQSSRRDGL